MSCAGEGLSATGPTGSGVFFVADASCLAREIAKVEEPAAAHDAARDDLDLLDSGAVLQEDALDSVLRANPDAEALFDDDPNEFWRQWEQPWREVIRCRTGS